MEGRSNENKKEKRTLSFRRIKEGDLVMRILAGKIPIELKVTKVDENLIHCGPWTFCRNTGVEIDEVLDWGNSPKHSGSFLRKERKGK